MQPYRAMKLKCFVLRLTAGTGLLLIGVSILSSVLREMLTDFDSASRIAYYTAIGINVLMIFIAAVLIYQAFHFERFVFGNSRKKYSSLKKDFENEDMISAGNLIMTDRFVLLFSMNFFHMCRIISTENITGCFEEPVYGTVGKPSDYTLYIYDKNFKCYTIRMDANKAEDGHIAKEKICSLMPWIYSENHDEFMDMIISKAGRRNVLTRVEKKRYQANSSRDVEAEAENELDELENDVKEKLDFNSLLGKKKK